MLRICVATLALAAVALAPAAEPFPASPGVWPVEAAGYPYDVPYGGHPPGGYERRIGKPYYWSVPGGTVPLTAGTGHQEGLDGQGFQDGSPSPNAGSSCGCAKGVGNHDLAGDHAAPAGYDVAGGSPPALHPAGGGPAGDPYSYHFGPGFYRSNEFGHYRFPYYSYRRPWYDVGHPVRVRDTNLPW